MSSAEAIPAAAGPPSVASDPRRWLALAVLAVFQFMIVVDTTVVNVALPSIQRSLHFSTSGLAWVVNGYILMAGGFLILGGKVADLVGRRRLFLIGVVVFAGASLVSGLAHNPGTLVGARFAQGLGEAIASPAAMSLVVVTFTDQKERVKALGLWGTLAGLGGTLGVLIGGVITSEISWRWIFLINLPVAVAVLSLTPRLVHESRSPGRPKLDVLGALLITGSLVLLVDGLLAASTHNWGSANVAVPLAIGGALLAAFIVSQALLASPLVPLRFFANRTRAVANLATMIGLAAFISLFFLLTLYMQEIGHYSALKTGLAYLPFGAGLLAGIGVSTTLLPKVGVRAGLVASFLLAAGGMLLFAQIGDQVHYASQLLPGILVFSFGQGIMFPALQNGALHKVGPTDAGLASGVQSTSLQIGGSLGLSVLVTAALRHAASRIAHGVNPVTATVDGYTLALYIAAAVLVAGALLVAVAFEKVNFLSQEESSLAAAGVAGAGIADESGVAPARAH